MCELELIAHSEALAWTCLLPGHKSKNVPVWPVKECFFMCAACMCWIIPTDKGSEHLQVNYI